MMTEIQAYMAFVGMGFALGACLGILYWDGRDDRRRRRAARIQRVGDYDCLAFDDPETKKGPGSVGSPAAEVRLAIYDLQVMVLRLEVVLEEMDRKTEEIADGN